MLTVTEVRQIVDASEQRNNIRIWHWGPETYSIHFGINQVEFLVDSQSLKICGKTENWGDWFRFDETDLAFRDIPETWWQRHKPLLIEIVQAIEASMNTTGPGNATPDVCH
jgi:hypothetical protein